MLSPAGGPARPLFPMLSRVEYVEPGYLLFAREGMLLAQRFDSRSGSLSGEPVAISDSVRYKLKEGFASFATSPGGAVAFRTSDAFRRRLAWFDRAGRAVDRMEALAPLGGPDESNDVTIDSEGRRALFDRTQPKTRTHNLWILDLERNTEVRVTPDATDERVGRWLPDKESIVYTAAIGGLVQLRRRDLTTGRVEALLPYGTDQQAGAVAFGGTQLTYATETDQGNPKVGLIPLSGDHKTAQLPQGTAFGEAWQFSPDGRALVLSSDASGNAQLYVASSASPTERIRISSGGSAHGTALWSRDSSEVFFLSPERQMISVPIRTAPSLSVGPPVALFTIREDAAWDTFDVSPDGKRFLAVHLEGAPEPHPINVILNWNVEAAKQLGQ